MLFIYGLIIFIITVIIPVITTVIIYFKNKNFDLPISRPPTSPPYIPTSSPPPYDIPTTSPPQQIGVCPDNWVIRSPPEQYYTCQGESYTGPCGKISGFNGYTLQRKAEWSRDCEAPWTGLPTIPPPPPPYIPTSSPPPPYIPTTEPLLPLNVCPDNWELKSPPYEKYLCNGNGYTGISICNNDVSFKGYTDEQKNQWSNLCKVPWTRIVSLDDCPYNWEIRSPPNESYTCGNLSYTGPCRPSPDYAGGFAGFKGYNIQQKLDWSENCVAPWYKSK